MKFTLDVVRKAEKQLAACKSCGECKHAIENIDRDRLKLTVYCTKHSKDVTGKTGFMCNDWSVKP